MTTQTNLNNAIIRLNNAVKASTCASDVAAYWTGLLNKRYALHANGTVQSTMSNPLAYFCVPLAGDGTKGRSHDFVMAQFDYALTHGLTKNAHIALRGVNESAIKAGMAFARPRSDSSLGSVEGRLAATMVSAQSNVKARQVGSRQVVTLEAAKQSNDRVTFENASLSLAAIIEKYSKAPKAEKPETVKASKANKAPKAA
jgi:hypothetical protein